MKKIIKVSLPLLILITFYACSKKDGITNQSYDAYGVATTQGLLKINLAFAYTIDYATFLIKINGKVVSNALQSRTPFPGGGYNTRGSNFALYLNLPQGTNTVAVIVPKRGTETDSIVYYTGSVIIPDNAPYTLHLTDTLGNPTNGKTQTLLVKNVINSMDTGFCRFKFVNLLPNLPSADLYLNGVLIKSNIPYLTATDTFSVRTGVWAPGYVAGVTATWTVRPAGALSTSVATATYASSTTLQSQAVMTIFSMGYVGGLTTRDRKAHV